MKRIILGLFTLLICCFSLNASADNVSQDKTLKGMQATVTEARQMMSSYYYDGTNIMLVNWSHDPVRVTFTDLNIYVDLSPIPTSGNYYYFYSDFNYVGLNVQIQNLRTGAITMAYAYTPSTVEIWDPVYLNASKDDKASLKVKLKSGI